LTGVEYFVGGNSEDYYLFDIEELGLWDVKAYLIQTELLSYQ
jgi:hypothetical protein